MTAQDRRSVRFYLLLILLAGCVGSAVLLGGSDLFAEEATATFPGAVLLGIGGLIALRPRRVA